MDVVVDSGYDLSVLAPAHGLPAHIMDMRLKLKMALAYGVLGRCGATEAKAAFWSFRQHRISLARVVESSPDIIHAHDWNALPIAARAASILNVPYIYDSHENAVDMFPERLLWRLVMPGAIAHLEKEGVKGAAGVITVSQIIADALEKRLECAPPQVIRNIPAESTVTARRGRNKTIVLHYHGILCSGRGLETAIQSIASLPEQYSLQIIGPWLQNSVRHRVAKRLRHPDIGHRVTISGAVPPGELVQLASHADIGLVLLKPTSTHNRGALPNKFFEYIHAGLMIIASGSDAMRAMIEEHRCGIFLADPTPENLTAALTDLSPERIRVFQRAALEAGKTLSWDLESRKLEKIYSRLSRARKPAANTDT
jgi:glycosyltransferase involved in cell wall biosynthesis